MLKAKEGEFFNPGFNSVDSTELKLLKASTISV